MKRLLVIVPDYVSDIVAKGEYQPRYYNPGELFDEVHILMTNQDQVDPAAVQRTVGKARLHLHNLPEDPLRFIQHSRLFRPWLLKPWARPMLAAMRFRQMAILDRWAQPGVKLARSIKPHLIRCHGNDNNAMVARAIKRELGIPYLVSLHINPDANPRRRSLNPEATARQQLLDLFWDDVEIAGLLEADLVLPVYEPIVPYLERVGCSRYEVAYNVLNGEWLRAKQDYQLHDPVRLISVGRHFELKDPSNIIRAVAGLPQARLTLVGDGPYQQRLVDLAAELGLSERVVFLPAVPNDKLCQILAEQDIFVIHTEHWEISKSLLEALLTGLPVIINRRKGPQTPELERSGIVHFVDNTPQDYQQALRKLIEDNSARQALGQKAFMHAQQHWAPEKTEAKYVEIYRRFLPKEIQ